MYIIPVIWIIKQVLCVHAGETSQLDASISMNFLTDQLSENITVIKQKH